jgi:dienelactone hydrolase
MVDQGEAGTSRRGRRRAAVITGLAVTAVTAVLSAGLAGCGGGSDDDDSSAADAPEATATTAATATDPATPLEVDVDTETFVDTSRPTPAGAETPARSDRTLVTRIAHPTSGGPYPLVVLAHGLTGHPDEYTDTVPLWAADGFVVASPRFPLTNRETPGAGNNIADFPHQPGDVSFVIDEVLAANDDPDSPLHGLVDPEAIGVVGHSLGGATSWAVSFDSAVRDDRIDSTVIFSGLTLDIEGGGRELDSGLPLLVLHGDRDIPLDADLAAYEQAVAPKWFVTLLGGEHVPPYTDAESPYDDLVNRTVLDFWHGTLDGDAEALERVTADATDPALSRVRHE